MIRFLNVNEGKNCPIRKVAENMIRGAVVTVDHATEKLGLATAGTGMYLVDVTPKYDGINAIIAPTDAGFESIKADELAIEVPTYVGERYATSELDPKNLAKGDKLTATAGKFVKATTGTVEWVYGGIYDDPTGLDMYIIEKIAPVTLG